MLFGIRKLIVVTVLFSMLFLGSNLANRNQVIAQTIVPPCESTITCEDVATEGITIQAITIESQRPFDHYLVWLAAGLAAVTVLTIGWTILQQNTHLVS
jgi:hypothetical protein